MLINTIYSTFQGEVNPFGIGHPSIFLRLQGCHLRCYKSTMGITCDTPESLSRTDAYKQQVGDIIHTVTELAEATGIYVVTLTGGDPLWNNKDQIHELLLGLTIRGFKVCVETSGTISWLPYSGISDDIYWIIDYKVRSTGIKNPDRLFKDLKHLQELSNKDYIKFVIYDEDDYDEAVGVIESLKDKTLATFAIGAYWGGKLSTFDIFNKLRDDGLLGKVVLNMQAHKMAVASNFKVEIPKNI